MKKINVTIIDPIGIHARPAGLLAQEASKFDSKIQITLDSKTANAKSIINLMALGVKKGNEIEISADGKDQDEALKAIKDLLKKQKLIK